MSTNQQDMTQSAYQFRVFNTATGKTAQWCRSQREADREMDHQKRRCERKGIPFSLVVIKESPEKEPAQ